MSKEDRDRMRARAAQLEAAMNEMRADLGLDDETNGGSRSAGRGTDADGTASSAPAYGAGRSIGAEAAYGAGRSAGAETSGSGGSLSPVSFAPGMKPGRSAPPQDFRAGTRRTSGLDYYRRQTAGVSRQGTSSLIIEETEEPFTQEDVQLYSMRKKYFNVPGEPELDRMEHELPAQIQAWKDDDAAGLSPDRLYMQVGSHLQKGQISDTVQQEMIMLSGSDAEADPGMKQFYSAFTLLQSNPSGKQIETVLDRNARIPSSSVVAEGIRVLSRAIRSAADQQAAINAEKDRKNRERQAIYDKRQAKAQKKYDSAKDRADRWRN